jgi:hypothetical protein
MVWFHGCQADNVADTRMACGSSAIRTIPAAQPVKRGQQLNRNQDGTAMMGGANVPPARSVVVCGVDRCMMMGPD